LKVIAAGSGPSLVQINDWHTDKVTVVGVNNVWRVTTKWDHLIHAGDYPQDLRKQLYMKKRAYQKVHSREGNLGFKASYCGMSKMPWEKARIYLGLPIYFGTMYWILHHLKPTHIGCIGFDMNYTPQPDGSTAAYGVGYDMQTRGIPDPLWQFKNVPEYIAMADPYKTLMDRLIALKGDTQIVNLSNDPKTMLPWDHVPFSEF
jgi:hypothetical protein